MSETSPQRGGRHRGDVGKREPRRAVDLRESDRDQPRRVATWARALAAVVLLDPSALPGPHSTDALTTAQSVGKHLTSERPLAKRHHAGDPSSGSVPRTGRIAAGQDVPTVLAVVDAAAALIEAGDEDSAFLLLALIEPASERPAGTSEALRLLTSTRSRAAARTPGGRSTAHMLPRRGSGGGMWGGSA